MFTATAQQLAPVSADMQGSEREEKKAVARRCIVTGEVFPKSEMIRFVLSPDATQVVADVTARLPGKGMWVHASRTHVDAAMNAAGFARVAGQSLPKDPAFADKVEAMLKRHALDLLSLCRRSGALVSGFEKVHAACKSNEAEILVEASDAAEDGKSKLAGVAKGIERIDGFSRQELGQITGREETVHVALLPSGITQRFMEAAKRLQGYNER